MMLLCILFEEVIRIFNAAMAKKRKNSVGGGSHVGTCGTDTVFFIEAEESAVGLAVFAKILAIHEIIGGTVDSVSLDPIEAKCLGSEHFNEDASTGVGDGIVLWAESAVLALGVGHESEEALGGVSIFGSAVETPGR